MSTKAKYGSSIGILLVGVLMALPFRNIDSSETTADGSQVASNEQQDASGRSSKTEPLIGDSGFSAEKSNSSKIKSKLLPDTVNTDSSQIVESTPSTRSNSHPDGELVAIAKPKQFRPADDEIRSTTDPKIDQFDSMHPVEFSSQQPKSVMPESVGPYQMKPVNSPRFLSASQSSQNPSYSSSSKSRNVVHYKLRDGDSLRSIAARYLGDPNRFSEILNDNRHVLTNGENFLPIGQFITIVQ